MLEDKPLHPYIKEYFLYLFDNTYYNDDEVEISIKNKYPHIKTLWDIHVKNLNKYGGFKVTQQKFYNSVYYISKYEKDLEKLLRKEKLKKLMNA